MKLIDGFGEKMLLPNVYYSEGRIAELEKNYPKAIEKYMQFKELSPSNTSVLRWLARSYRAAGDLKTARYFVDDIVKRNPASGKNLYEAALYYLAIGDKDKALKYVKKANEIWKDAEEIYKPAKKARDLEEELRTD